MRKREQLIEAVRDRIYRYQDDHDADALLTEQAVHDAVELVAVTDPETDVGAALVLAIFHWCRSSVLPDGAGPNDLEAAVRFFAPVYRDQPKLVPPQFHHHYRRPEGGDAGQDSDASVVGKRAMNLFATYADTGDPAVLVEAVEAGRTAVAATPHDDRRRTTYLAGQAGATYRQFERTGDTSLLDEAISLFRAAVAAAPDDDPRRPVFLANLGTALRELSERTEDTNPLDEAVTLFRAATAATPDRPDRARQLTGLASTLRTLSEQTGDIDPLTEALEVSRAALVATPADAPDRIILLANLGTVLRELSERTGDRSLLSEAIHYFEQAAGTTTAPASQRIELYLRLTSVAPYLDQEPTGALAAMKTAVSLVPQVATRALARPDREYLLGQLWALAGRAAATAVNAGQPDRAVELLEQTRGVLVADVLDARSGDLTRLRESSPDLADAFFAVRARLDDLDRAQPSTRMTHSAGSPDAADVSRAGRELAEARRKAHTDWENVLERIRKQKGFNAFLRAPGITQLAAQAADGPIVLLYADSTRCDALILSDDPGDPVRVVPLTDLTEYDAARQGARFVTALHTAGRPDASPNTRIAAQREVTETLAWIWDTVTEPVLSALDYTNAPSGAEEWPRVWWCPVGVLAYLPLHSAGYHTDLTSGDADRRANPRSVLDRAVSSYIPTVRGFAHARTHRPASSTRTTTIIAVPDAPGAAPLPGVIGEVNHLTALIPDARLLPHPTRQGVLDALPDTYVAHFACHGYMDMKEPAASRLVLYDHRIEPLTVTDIGALDLTGGLAFLSACSTAVTSPKLTNEAIHLTGAFHLAGYQHVVGTLWPIDDQTAQSLVADFFKDLTHVGTAPPEINRSAHALHRAARRLRANYLSTPTLWAGYTHTGT